MLTVVPGLKTDVRPDLRVTPRLRFNLDVLHATRAEIMRRVDDAVEENPFVERPPTWEGGRAPRSAERGDLDLDALPAPAPSLQDDLRAQLSDTWLSRAERLVADFIIGNIDDDGFLEATTEEIAAQAGIPDLAVIEGVLASVH